MHLKKIKDKKLSHNKKISTGETLFLLVYNTKAMISTEIKCSSHHVFYYISEDNE
jgi:hypothetical protein